MSRNSESNECVFKTYSVRLLFVFLITCKKVGNH